MKMPHIASRCGRRIPPSKDVADSRPSRPVSRRYEDFSIDFSTDRTTDAWKTGIRQGGSHRRREVKLNSGPHVDQSDRRMERRRPLRAQPRRPQGNRAPVRERGARSSNGKWNSRSSLDSTGNLLAYEQANRPVFERSPRSGLRGSIISSVQFPIRLM
jgi:hypothetical protein